ncbi:MAG TPA: hypothetical protein VFO73_10270 [Candidatus Limnocylindrales bacterium]|nr:hypothetical protein [Candidatus Limnocylindrales bacterium]
MDQSTQLVLLIVAALVGVVAALLIMRRQRIEQADATRENPYATSTEGEKRCPKCGMGNLWTSRNCISCQARLPG